MVTLECMYIRYWKDNYWDGESNGSSSTRPVIGNVHPAASESLVFDRWADWPLSAFLNRLQEVVYTKES